MWPFRSNRSKPDKLQQAKKEAVQENGQEVKQNNNNNNRKESKKDKKAEKTGHQQNGSHTDNVAVLHLSEQVRICTELQQTSKVAVVRAKAKIQNILSKKSLENTKQIQPWC